MSSFFDNLFAKVKTQVTGKVTPLNIAPIQMTATPIKRTSAQICAKTGMPPALVPRCEQLLKSGMTIAQAGEQLQKEYAEAAGAASPVKPGMSDSTKKLLVYGGAGAVGLFVLYKLIKK